MSNNRINDGGVSAMAAIFGILLTISGLALVIINNITTVVGTVGLTGGQVGIPDDFYLQIPEIIHPGKFGLFFAIIVSIIANAFQFVAIILRDRDILNDNPQWKLWVNLFDVATRVFDIGTAIWYVSSGYDYFGSGTASEIGTGIFIMLFHFVFVVLFLTVGSEVFFAFGIRIVVRYGFDGLLSIIDGLVAFQRFRDEADKKLDELLNYGKQNNKQNNNQQNNQSRQQSQFSHPRPSWTRPDHLGEGMPDDYPSTDKFSPPERRGPGRPPKVNQ